MRMYNTFFYTLQICYQSYLIIGLLYLTDVQWHYLLDIAVYSFEAKTETSLSH